MALLHVNQLAVGTVASSAFVTAYTVPAGMRTVLRSVVAKNTTATATLLLVDAAGVTIFDPTLAVSGAAGDTLNVQPWVVLLPGQLIRLASGGGRAVTYILSGTVYTI